MILHITTLREWEKAQEAGVYTTSSLKTEGFIHCSTVNQVIGTANIFFKGQSGLVLLCINENSLKSDCKYENPTSGQHDIGAGNLFPHIYGPINLPAVIKVVDFPINEDGTFTVPEELIN